MPRNKLTFLTLRNKLSCLHVIHIWWVSIWWVSNVPCLTVKFLISWHDFLNSNYLSLLIGERVIIKMSVWENRWKHFVPNQQNLPRECLSNYKIIREFYVAYVKNQMWKLFTNLYPTNISGLFTYWWLVYLKTRYYASQFVYKHLRVKPLVQLQSWLI